MSFPQDINIHTDGWIVVSKGRNLGKSSLTSGWNYMPDNDKETIENIQDNLPHHIVPIRRTRASIKILPSQYFVVIKHAADNGNDGSVVLDSIGKIKELGIESFALPSAIRRYTVYEVILVNTEEDVNLIRLTLPNVIHGERVGSARMARKKREKADTEEIRKNWGDDGILS